MCLNASDSIGDGSIILISHVADMDAMQELLTRLVTLLDWEEYFYTVSVRC